MKSVNCGDWYTVRQTQSRSEKFSSGSISRLFTCGSSIEDLELGDIVNVYTRPLNCYEPFEKVYYSAGYNPICVYCGDDCASVSQSQNDPLCEECKDNGKNPIQK